MRPIDADALKETIKWLKVESPDVKATRFISRTIQEIFPQVIDDEPAIETEPDNGWISVKDRLPEDNGKYMVWYKGECEICEFDTDSQTFGYTYDDYDEMYSHLVCWDDGIHKDVTHWRLLPEPPKGE